MFTTIRGNEGLFGKGWLRTQQIYHEVNGADTGAKIRARTPHRGTYAPDYTIWLPLITLASSTAYLHALGPVPLRHILLSLSSKRMQHNV